MYTMSYGNNYQPNPCTTPCVGGWAEERGGIVQGLCGGLCGKLLYIWGSAKLETV